MQQSPNHRLFISVWTIFFLPLLFFPAALFAQRDIPDRPEIQTGVYDDAHLLTAGEKLQLEQKLIRYADTTSTQIVVVTIPSLEGEYIGTYAAEWAQKWGIGQAGKDNGVLLMASKLDHKFWITTGYGVEDALTDAKSGLIYNQIVKPAFQRGEYYQGLEEGTDAIIEVLEGKFQAESNGSERIQRILPFLIFALFILILIRRKNGGGGGSSSGGNWLFDSILLSSMGRGGGFGGRGGFGGGGGGFGGGFGGGGFGGGGAGGSW